MKSDKLEDTKSGDFRLILSYNILDDSKAQYVSHIWSSSYDYSPYIQRLELLERLGFKRFKACQHTNSECFYHAYPLLDRRAVQDRFRGEPYHEAFEKLVSNLHDIFKLIRHLDSKLQDAGIKLPEEVYEVKPILVQVEDEKAYREGERYDIYKDLKNMMKQASREVFVVDAYPDESIFELYLDEVPKDVKIKILTNHPQGKFEKVGKFFAADRDISVAIHPKIHDRFVFIDDECWVLGASIKDAGKKPTYMIHLRGKDDFYSIFSGYFDKGNKIL